MGSGLAGLSKYLKIEKNNRVHWNGPLGILLGIVFFFASQFIALLLMLIYPSIERWSYKSSIAWLNKSTIAQFLYILFAETIAVSLVLLFIRLVKAKPSDIGLRKFNWNDLLYGLLAYLAYFLLYIIMVIIVKIFTSINLNQKQDVGFNNVQGSIGLILTFISLVILPPIAEEIITRGLLYSSAKKFMPKIVAGVFISLLFGLAHLGEGVGGLLWIGFMDTFLLSLTLVYLREKTNGIYAGMFTHGIKNFVAYASLYLAPFLASHIH